MKATLFALFLGLLMVGCGESSNPSGGVDMTDTAPKKDAIETAVDRSKLQYRNGFCYLRNEETPFTGRGASFYDNGQKRLESTFKEAKQYGPYIAWYENGQKKYEGNVKDGKKDGLTTVWYESGKKKREVNYKDDKSMSAKVWKPNGEKCPVTSLKDGNGFWVQYRENGTEQYRFTYKDGERVDYNPLTPPNP